MERTKYGKAGSRHRFASRLGWMLCFCLTLGLGALVTPQAKADFITQYPLADFTLTNSPSLGATGFATMSGGSIVLTGDNSGSGEPGTTDLLTTATLAGLIQFDFSYSTLNPFPMDNNGGYLLNGVFVQLADTNGQSGVAQFHVNLGDIFGFQVGTMDNQFEPGVLTISSAVPEPRTGLVLLTGIAGILSRLLWLCNRRSRIRECA
jgi:hypothetical protein